MAQRLRDNLEKAEIILKRHRNSVPRFDDKLGLISSIRDFLDGAGDPAILVRIEDLGDGEVTHRALGAEQIGTLQIRLDQPFRAPRPR